MKNPFKKISTENYISCKINFNINYQQWSHLFLSINKSNLAQSWHYGEAKIKSQGWKILRGIITENEKPIALIQAWYKKFLFIKFVRVSYGPLWIIDNPSLEKIKGVFYAIRRCWNLKKLYVLSIAPNLENTPENSTILTDLGFFKRDRPLYQSGLIDLSQSVESLRIKLRQSWRRHIKDAEKMGLTFHVSQDIADFNWMIARFKILRREKKFFGHDTLLLDALYNSSFDFHETSVAVVSCAGEKLTGILISFHGLCCTPLITWIGKAGRDTNSGNFLIWNCLLYAKNKGCMWFDLGSTTNNNFKTRLPHIPYQLMGEYF